MIPVSRSGAQSPVVLTRQECLQLLGQSTFGRIGITFRALPTVLPVTYRLIDERIILRTGRGTTLDAATAGTIVAFEVDDIDPQSHAGWSVMVTGEARQVTDPDDLDRMREIGVPHWPTSDVEATVEITTTILSGRRMGQR